MYRESAPCVCRRGFDVEAVRKMWVYAHYKEISQKSPDDSGKRWEYEPAGEAKGRFTILEGLIIETCLPLKEFSEFGQILGLDARKLRATTPQKTVRLNRQAKPVRCFVFTFDPKGGTEDANN